MARSLIAQLLHLNPVSLDYLHEVAVGSGERHPTIFKTYHDILENLATTHNLLFIGIDGLDECEGVDRQLILNLMHKILKASSSTANVKVFLTSQRMNDINESLRSAVRFDIKHSHVSQDIQNYVHTRSSDLCRKFGYGPEKQTILTSGILSKPDGVFTLMA